MFKEDKRWLHNNVRDAFSTSIFKPLLTVEHLDPFKIEIKKMTMPDMEADEDYNFRGWQLIKGDERFLISDTDAAKNPIDIKSILPILPKMPIELGYRGNVYKHVKKPVSMRIKAEKHYEPWEIIKMLSALGSTNQDHQEMLQLIAMTSVITKFNIALASNPGLGKDFTVDGWKPLGGRTGVISSPTLAKLEERTSVLKWLMVNEVCNMSGQDWKVTQGYLLDFGAHKNEVTRHSCGMGRGEVIDSRELSLTLAFNDITEYNNYEDKFFDFATDGNVLNRFMTIRLWGEYTEDFDALLDDMSIPEYVHENMPEFKKLLYTIEYLKQTYDKNKAILLHGYDRSSFSALVGRDKTNMNRLLDIFDMCSPTQEQFNKYCKVFELASSDYRKMTAYPFAFHGLLEKMKVPKTIIEKAMKQFASSIMKRKNGKLQDGITIAWMKGKYMKNNTWESTEWEFNHNYLMAIYNANTFIEKLSLINLYVNPGQRKIEDKSIWKE